MNGDLFKFHVPAESSPRFVALTIDGERAHLPLPRVDHDLFFLWNGQRHHLMRVELHRRDFTREVIG